MKVQINYDLRHILLENFNVFLTRELADMNFFVFFSLSFSLFLYLSHSLSLAFLFTPLSFCFFRFLGEIFSLCAFPSLSSFFEMNILNMNIEMMININSYTIFWNKKLQKRYNFFHLNILASQPGLRFFSFDFFVLIGFFRFCPRNFFVRIFSENSENFPKKPHFHVYKLIKSYNNLFYLEKVFFGLNTSLHFFVFHSS